MRAAAGSSGQLCARLGAARSRGEEIPPGPLRPSGLSGVWGTDGARNVPPGCPVPAGGSPRTFHLSWCLRAHTDPCPRCQDAAKLVHPALPLGKLRHGWVGMAALPGRARLMPACFLACAWHPAQLGQARTTVGVPHNFLSGWLRGDWQQGSKSQQLLTSLAGALEIWGLLGLAPRAAGCSCHHSFTLPAALRPPPALPVLLC